MPAPAQDRQAPVNAELAASIERGFGRLVFTFPEEVKTDVQLANNILVIKFARPVKVSTEALQATFKELMNMVRADPDGTAIRIALSQKITLNTMAAGEKLSWRQEDIVRFDVVHEPIGPCPDAVGAFGGAERHAADTARGDAGKRAELPSGGEVPDRRAARVGVPRADEVVRIRQATIHIGGFAGVCPIPDDRQSMRCISHA